MRRPAPRRRACWIDCARRFGVRHYSIRTEHACLDRARRFILFHGKCHSIELGIDAVAAFLTRLAVGCAVELSTRCQAELVKPFHYRVMLDVQSFEYLRRHAE